MSNVKDFLKRKDIVITPQRYLIAVSYTHLDVYKRQTLSTAPVPAT